LRVNDAIILAAGLGRRLRRDVKAVYKPVVKVGGLPLILYSIASLRDIGITNFYLVVNEFNKDDIIETVSNLDLNINIIVNRYPDKGNGYSLILGMEHIESEYFVLGMSDHIYEYGVYKELVRFDVGGILIAADPAPRLININEATKMNIQNSRVIDIGKELEAFTHVDMGLFLIDNDLYPVFSEWAEHKNVVELSFLIKSAINNGYTVRAAEIKGYNWIDIDTLDDIYKIESSPELLLDSLHANLEPILSRFRDKL
jgi:CDP-L-myo-inositol myo-inositolphosphotransferase